MLEIFKLASLPMLGMIFNPVHMIVNVATCSRIGDLELAGLGLGSLTLGIMLVSIGVYFSMASATFIAQAHGAGYKRMCRVYLNR